MKNVPIIKRHRVRANGRVGIARAACFASPEPVAPTPINLDLGCGDKPLPDHIGVDRKFGGEVYPLAYPDNSVDNIHASHVLEHFGHGQTVNVLADWVRALKPGGRIQIAVPDFDKIIAAYNSPECGWPVEGYLMGGHTDANDAHGAIFNETKLREMMFKAGLRSIKHWKSNQRDCAALPVSLNLEGVKRGPASVKGVHAILSAPRLGFTDQATCLMEAMGRLGVPTRIRQGVFWGQTLTTVMEESIAAGAEYILTTDYDSLFTLEDVEELVWLARSNPDAGAIFALQIGRERTAPLLTMRGEDGENRGGQIHVDEFAKDLLPANTGHFGLTIIRVDALARLPKPWFLHHPDPEGGWGDGHVDEDIHFWKEWVRAGNKAFQANRIPIGHLQLMATWPDRNLGAVHQYLTEYRRDGKPEGAWK